MTHLRKLESLAAVPFRARSAPSISDFVETLESRCSSCLDAASSAETPKACDERC